MSLSERLRPVLSTIEFQLARSLPVLENGKEIVFFYKTDRLDSTHDVVKEIKYIVYIDVFNGETQKVNASDVLPKDLVAITASLVNVQTLDVYDQIKAEDQYLEGYENLYLRYRASGTIDKNGIKQIADSFLKLTSGSSLTGIYAYIAKEYYDMIAER